MTRNMISRSRELSVSSERTQGLITLPTGTIASKAGLNGIEEVLITERFVVHSQMPNADAKIKASEKPRRRESSVSECFRPERFYVLLVAPRDLRHVPPGRAAKVIRPLVYDFRTRCDDDL